MSKVSALAEAHSPGAVSVAEAGLTGMVTLKGDLGSAKLAAVLSVPGQRGVVEQDGRMVAWMAADELLIVLAHDEADALVAELEAALAGEHFIAVNVSDARALFRVEGQGAREAIAKLAPADLHPESFGAGEMRRTRLAQVPAAFWLSGEVEISVICFRSVAQYVFDILSLSAKDGGEVGYF